MSQKLIWVLLVSIVWLSVCQTLEGGLEQAVTPPAALATPAPEPTALASPTPAPASPATLVPGSMPELNTVYWGNYAGQLAAFVTSLTDQTYSVDGVEQTNPFVGRLLYPNGASQQPFNFVQLENACKVFTLPDPPGSLIIALDEPQNFLYLLNLYHPAGAGGSNAFDFINRLYALDLGRQTGQAVWQYETRLGRYPGYIGAGTFLATARSFVVLGLSACYGCNAPEPLAALVVNTTTGQEKLLGLVGDVQLRVEQNSVTYRNLRQVEESCDPGPGCSANGTRLVYQPAGEELTTPLP